MPRSPTTCKASSPRSRLRDEADNVVDELINPGEIDTDIGYPEGYSAEETKTVGEDEKRESARTIEKEIEKNLSRKLREAENSLKTALKTGNGRRARIMPCDLPRSWRR